MEKEVFMKNFLVAFLAICVMAFAEPRVHDGFFLNFKTGLGFLNVESDESERFSVDLSYILAEHFTIKIGGAINPHLVIAGVFSVSGASGEVTSDYYNEFYERKSDAVVLNFLLGPGVVFYPAQGGIWDNFFVGGAFGLGSCGVFLLEDEFYRNDGFYGEAVAAGFGLQLEVGKEWWVSGNWSLGFDIAYTYVFGEDVDFSDFNWHSHAFQLRFSISRS